MHSPRDQGRNHAFQKKSITFNLFLAIDLIEEVMI